jgi:TadE-like protein
MIARLNHQVCGRRGKGGRLIGNCARGSAAIEWLAAAPIVMLLGLGVLQWSLVFFSRSSVEFALTQASREGAQGHALVSNIEAGLARGMIPYWGLAVSGQPLDLALPNALLRLGAEKASGALIWKQISPTEESFTDWAVPARDAMGEEIASVVEIPNDALQFRKQTVGASSGQTLKDANLLKIEMRYGVQLNVPLIAPLVVRIMEQVNSCPNARAGGIKIGTIRMGEASAAEKANGTPWTCSFYRAKDANGIEQLRWPVQMIAMVRMQTPARKSGATAGRKEDPLAVAMTPASPGAGGNDAQNTPNGDLGQGGGGGAPAPGGGIGGKGDPGGPSGPAIGGGSANGNGSANPAGGVSPSGMNTPGPANAGNPVGSVGGSNQAGGGSTVSPSPPQSTFKAEVLGRIEQEGRTQVLASCGK